MTLLTTPESDGLTPDGLTPDALTPGSIPASGRFFGHLRQMEADSLGALRESFRAHGDVSTFRFGPLRAFLLAHPGAAF